MPANKQKMPTLHGTAKFKPETVDRENMTVEMVFTTGEAGIRQGWWSDPYEESLEVSESAIRSERLNKGLSLLDSHDRYAGISGVLGITEEWRIEDGALVGTCRFSKNQKPVFDDVADGKARLIGLSNPRIPYYKADQRRPDREAQSYRLGTFRAIHCACQL